MKKIFNLFLIAAFCLVGMISANAQALKFGHINSADLLAAMPEIKDAEKKLQEFSATLEGQLKVMTNEYQTKVTSFQSQEASMADPIRQSKIKEITDLENRIQDFQQTAQESISKKKEEIYAPILKKAEDAIVVLAKEKGYAYVFDTSLGATIYAQESDDMMDIVKKKLGITSAAPAPAAAPKK